ncbi:MAG TPA: GNAT family N-acetyltransferase [Chloroflexia bacterium]|nr:GNAT family N-acetyltransferase [Chloroflexia bacterium]
MFGTVLAALMCLGALIGLVLVAPSVYYSWRVAPVYYNLARIGLPLIALIYFGPRLLGIDFPSRAGWLPLVFLVALALIVLSVAFYLYTEPGRSQRRNKQPVTLPLDTSDIVVRTALPEDLPGAGRIFAEAFQQSFDLDFGPDHERNGRILSELLAVKMAEVQVAVEKESGQVVGAIWLDLGDTSVPAMTFGLSWPVLRRYLSWLHALYYSLYAMPSIMARRGSDRQGYIQWLGVDPRWQGRHIGRLLVERAVELSKNAGKNEVGLHTERSNERARKLYTHMGFQERGLSAISPRIYYVKLLY